MYTSTRLWRSSSSVRPSLAGPFCPLAPRPPRQNKQAELTLPPPGSVLFLLTSLTFIATFLYLPQHILFLLNRAWFYVHGDSIDVLEMTKDAVQTLAGGAEEAAETAAEVVEGVTEAVTSAATEIVREL